MLRRHEQQTRRRRNLGLEPGDAIGQIGLPILIVKRQVIDLDKSKGESVGPQLTERPREPAIDGFAAIAADDDRNLEHCHNGPTLVKIRYRG